MTTQNKHPHIAIKVTKDDFDLDTEAVSTWAIKRIMSDTLYGPHGPGMIRGGSYEETIERVRLEVEENGGVWVIFSPEAVMRPAKPPRPERIVSIQRIV